MEYRVNNLGDLLNALEKEGLLTYTDCGDILTVEFDKENVSSVGDITDINHSDIRFFNARGEDLIVNIESAMCNDYTDVHFE